ncbi:MAG TPA: leucyl aminopeptidase [Ignavibacteriaceae bacterium]|nr:leucyl aminopeptidase [Ignavibacteriaceae bacterium]
MFKLKFIAEPKKIVYKPLSVSIKYLIDEKKLGNSLKLFEKVSNIKLSAYQRKNFLYSKGSSIRISKPDGKPDEIVLVKVKIDEKFTQDFFRNQLAGFIKSISSEEINNLHITIPKYESFKKYYDSEEYFYQSFIEGLALGNYSFDLYKKSKDKVKPLNVYFYASNSKKLNSALSVSKNVIDGINFTKELQNEPGNVITPNELSLRIKTKFKNTGVKITVFNEKEIQKRKMGGLLAVGMGSSNPPRFIILQYNGITGKNKKSKTIALVGKGVTFDAGGISIKPASGMGEMKADMSGAAVVAGTILSAAKAKLPVNLLGVIPSAENMVSGSAMRPGDVFITASGKSIEVDNTDAEGRMILADALDFASRKKPDVIIDLATLTGACVVALGELAAGLFTKNDKLADQLFKSGMKTYDRVWRLPMWDDYNDLITSSVADVNNVGNTRWAGAITAAKFLEHFVDKNINWAHLDIAGPAMANNTNNYTKKYMTGFGVRLLFDYLSAKAK